MAYDKKKIFEQAKEVITSKRLIFMDEVPDFLPCNRSTFYSYFPDGSDELDTFKNLLSINKTQIKTSMRKKWYDSDNATLQMGLMKLIATPEELRKLSMNHQVTEEAEKPIFKEIDLDVQENDSTD
jgi:hypothetical protein